MLAPMYCTQNATRYRAYGLGLGCVAVSEVVDVDVAIVVVGDRGVEKSGKGESLARGKGSYDRCRCRAMGRASALHTHTTTLVCRTLSYRRRTCHAPAAMAAMIKWSKRGVPSTNFIDLSIVCAALAMYATSTHI